VPQRFEPREVAVDHLQVLLHGGGIAPVECANEQVLLRRQVPEDMPALQRLNNAQVAYLLGVFLIDPLPVPLDVAIGDLALFGPEEARYGFELGALFLCCLGSLENLNNL